MAQSPKPFLQREPRSDIRLRAQLFFDGVQRDAELQNVSLSGGRLLVPFDPPHAQTIVALAIIPEIGNPIYFHASVIRVEKIEGGTSCALKFINLAPESEGRLAYLIKKKAAKK